MTQSRRVSSIDAVRGIVMIVMALDHVRDFIHRAAMSASPTDLATTTPALFFTRWITHFCAPAFMFTAGLGAYLWWQGGRTRGQLSVFLLTRGLWLVVLELTVMRLAYNFTCASAYPVLLLVLWVLGLCMIVMAALVWLPLKMLAALGFAVIALHNLLDGVTASRFGDWAAVWNLIHQVGGFKLGDMIVIVGYPLIPWVAVMALGFCAGPLFSIEPTRRRKYLTAAGVAATIGFITIRAVNAYGDPAPWTSQPSPLFTLLSFLNTTKYPPSLVFLLMTLGPTLIALAWLDRVSLKATNPVAVFGRVPLFYFVAHFYAAHLAAVALAATRYGADVLGFMFHPVPSMGGPAPLFPAGFGYELWVVYVVWIAIVMALYPACRWFARLKAERPSWWMSYL